MGSADCCRNELEFRICTNCKNIQYKIYKTVWKKCQCLLSTLANVCYFFIIYAFINGYYYFWTFNTSMGQIDLDFSLSSVDLCMRDYNSLCMAVMICVTLLNMINIQYSIHTHTRLLTGFTTIKKPSEMPVCFAAIRLCF